MCSEKSSRYSVAGVWVATLKCRKREIIKWVGAGEEESGILTVLSDLWFCTLGEFRRPWRVLSNGRCHLAFFNRIMFAAVLGNACPGAEVERARRYIHTHIYM